MNNCTPIQHHYQSITTLTYLSVGNDNRTEVKKFKNNAISTKVKIKDKKFKINVIQTDISDKNIQKVKTETKLATTTEMVITN